MTIHSGDPFATPAGDRSPVRRLRGRLAAPVTVWTAPGPAGLTVSSVLVADGTPGLVLGLVDEESELLAAARTAGVFLVAPLAPGQERLADRFAGVLPAPGGLFAGLACTGTRYGPLPDGLAGWAGCRLLDVAPVGYAVLVRGEIEQVELGEPAGALLYLRGRYHRAG